MKVSAFLPETFIRAGVEKDMKQNADLHVGKSNDQM